MKTIKNPLMTARQRKKGFTLTEIAIVLGIIGLILGAIWSAAASVYNNQRNTHANTAILQVVQGIRGLMATSSTVGAVGNITPSLVSAGIIPSDLVNGVGANGPWPGSTLQVWTAAATDTAFTIEMTGVTQSGCISLITNVAGASRDPGLTSVGATLTSGTVLTLAGGAALPLTTTPLAASIPASTAAAACSATTSTNVVGFEFTIK